jgi:hypothetical protein
MMIIGVDYHPSFQAIAFFVEETGECGEAVHELSRKPEPIPTKAPRAHLRRLQFRLNAYAVGNWRNGSTVS